MSRMLEMFVYGVIAASQLALALFLLGLYSHSPARAAPAHSIYNAPQRHVRDSAAQGPASQLSGAFGGAEKLGSDAFYSIFYSLR